MSTIAACWIGSSRPTAPKSISPSVPSARTNTLPGWGSAWKKPSRMTWSSIERSSWSASAAAVDARRVEAARRRDTVNPSKRSWTSTRRVHSWRCSFGHAHGRSRRAAPPSRSSRRPRGGSRARPADPSANWASISPERTPRPNGVRRWARSASSASAARSRSIVTSMPGRCTLTTTSSPVRSTGRWVWPIDAAASGSHSNSAKTASIVAELGLEHGGDALAGLGRHPVLQRGQLLAHVGRQEVDAGRGDLAELDVDAAGLLEHPAQPQGLAVEGDRRGPDREAAEALPPGEADQLAIATEDGDAAADGPDRTRRDDEPGPLADRQRAGTGEQVEATAAVIVAGMPMATRCSMSPSAPQSHRLTPSATTTAMPHPRTPASSAVPHPRRMPSRRSDTLVMTTASDDADDDPDGDADRRCRRRSRSSTAPRARRGAGAAQRSGRSGRRPPRRARPAVGRRARRRGRPIGRRVRSPSNS